jgi:hypothetical protein
MTVNKQTTKVVQDGVELTWHQETDGDAKPEDVAKFYVDSVKALQKFKEEDPRTQPALRKEDKARKDFRKTVEEFVSWGFVLVFASFFAYQCGQSQHGPSRWGGDYHLR